MNKKLILTVTVWLVSLLMATSLVYVLATGSMSNSTFEAGTQVETASYTIWREGATCYSKNGSTGEISSSSNASLLTINALTSMPDGGSLSFLPGTYNWTAQVSITTDEVFRIVGYGATIQPAENDLTVFYVQQEEVLNKTRTVVEGFCFNNTGGYTGTIGVQVDSSYGVTLKNLKFQNFHTAIHLYNNQAGEWTESTHIENIDTWNCAYTVLFEVGAGLDSFGQTYISNVFMDIFEDDRGIYIASGNPYRSYFLNVVGWLNEDNASVLYIDGQVVGSVIYVAAESSLAGPSSAYVVEIDSNAVFGYHSTSSQYKFVVDSVGTGFTERIYNPHDIAYLTKNGAFHLLAGGETELSIMHNLTQAPTCIQVVPSWSTTIYITNRNATYFDLDWGTNPVGAQRVYWYGEVFEVNE